MGALAQKSRLCMVGGISNYGKAAVVLGLIVMLAVGLMNLPKEEAA